MELVGTDQPRYSRRSYISIKKYSSLNNNGVYTLHIYAGSKVSHRLGCALWNGNFWIANLPIV